MASPPVHLAVRAIRDEYLDLPGLSLTQGQMQRLFRLDALTCEAVTAALVDVSFLVRNGHGRYVRRDRASCQLARTARRRPRQGRAQAA
jgi:hypothetical protein